MFRVKRGASAVLVMSFVALGVAGPIYWLVAVEPATSVADFAFAAIVTAALCIAFGAAVAATRLLLASTLGRAVRIWQERRTPD